MTNGVWDWSVSGSLEVLSCDPIAWAAAAACLRIFRKFSRTGDRVLRFRMLTLALLFPLQTAPAPVLIC